MLDSFQAEFERRQFDDSVTISGLHAIKQQWSTCRRFEGTAFLKNCNILRLLVSDVWRKKINQLYSQFPLFWFHASLILMEGDRIFWLCNIKCPVWDQFCTCDIFRLSVWLLKTIYFEFKISSLFWYMGLKRMEAGM